VSRATARIVGRGHPWILRDDDTDDTSCFAPGTRVRVEGPDGGALGIACVEGSGRLTARMWSEAGRQDPGPSVEARVARALEHRAALIHPPPGQQPTRPATDVFRLVHGEADGLPGLFVDRLAGVLRVLVTGPGSGSYRERAVDALVSQLRPSLGSDPPVIEVLHLRDRPPGEHRCTVLSRGARAYEETSEETCEETTRMPVRERGVVFLVDPGLASPGRSSPGFGLYPDQRENRARLVSRASGGRLLNLFAHTGAFSVAWLAGGGGEAVSVDLSGAYLRWLDENLEANGIDPTRHRGVRQDGRRFVEALDRGERFDAIVVDPPTAASAGRRFWSVSRDLPVLVERLLGHLAPGGRLLVSRNDRRRGALRSLVEQAARRAHLDLQSIEPAPPGRDFPRRRGFPEGDPFAAVLVTRS
jgi:23S rRNA (cytosine1962-C5)-methyltransferase